MPASVLLIMDANSIAAGRPPGAAPEDIKEADAAVGVRDSLPLFSKHVGETMVIAAGQDSVNGWFTLTAVPVTWASADADVDGPSNFVLAGPGLGSPDHLSSRVTLLGDAGFAPWALLTLPRCKAGTSAVWSIRVRCSRMRPART